MNTPYTVDEFSSLDDVHARWSLTRVRVDFVWEDVREPRLLIFLIDQNVS